MDNSLEILWGEARRLFDSGMYAKAEGKCREVILLAKQRGDDGMLGHGYMWLAACLERLGKVTTIHDSREVALTDFSSSFSRSTKSLWLYATRLNLFTCVHSARIPSRLLLFTTADPCRVGSLSDLKKPDKMF
jgi:hypothetical protein